MNHVARNLLIIAGAVGVLWLASGIEHDESEVGILAEKNRQHDMSAAQPIPAHSTQPGSQAFSAPEPARARRGTYVEDSDAIRQCTDAVRARLTFPSSFTSSLFDPGQVSRDGRDLFVMVDFEAKNALGAELPYRGRCSIQNGMIASVNVSPR